VPRNRSARLAVLGSALPGARPVSYPSRTSRAFKRRLVAGVLLLLSLALITVYFREPASGRLHDAQGVGATALRPFEIAAERVARPFRDAYGYLSGLVHAKAENKRLHAQVDRYRQLWIQSQNAVSQNTEFKRLLRYLDSPSFPASYDGVPARVAAVEDPRFAAQIIVSVGSSDGVRLYAPVVTADGLVGQVTSLTSGEARVTLLTDETSAVSARDPKTRAPGLVRHGEAGSDSLILDRVKKEQRVAKGDPIITSGWRSGKLSSEYPPGIPVGVVTSVGQNDTELFKQVQVQPYVDFSSLDTVVVLVAKKPPLRLP
jgi:rod shape-determining protein MreC